MKSYRERDIYFLAALGLLVIHLGIYAIVDPFLGPSHGDFLYLRIADRIAGENNWFMELANRQFDSYTLAFARILFPGRFQGMFYLHMLTLYFISLGLFHILRRLMPGYAWFAFLVSAVAIVYVPEDAQHITYWLAPYSWVLFLYVVAVILLIEFALQQTKKSWFLLLIAPVLAYVVTRGYESFVPLLICTPGILFYLSYRSRHRISRREIIATGIWFIPVIIGALQFAIPYARGDEKAWYQSTKNAPHFSIPDLINNTVEHQVLGFPYWHLVDRVSFDYVLPGLMLAGSVLLTTWLFKRRFPTECKFPSGRALMVMAVIGAAFVSIAGAGYIYADLLDNQRNQFFSFPGHALMVMSLMMLVAIFIQHQLHLPRMRVFAGLLTFLFVLSSQWIFHHNQSWYGESAANGENYPFYEMTDFHSRVRTVLPVVKDDSVILLHECSGDELSPADFFSASDVYSSRYLFEWSEGKGVLSGLMSSQIYAVQGVSSSGLDTLSASDPLPPEFHYGYNQVIVLTCDGQDIVVVDTFPEGFAPEGADIDAYNPYLRIENTFIPAKTERILAQ